MQSCSLTKSITSKLFVRRVQDSYRRNFNLVERRPFLTWSVNPAAKRSLSPCAGFSRGISPLTMATHSSIDQTAVKKDWSARDFTFGTFVDPPGQVWADFTHETDELVMLAEGLMELRFHGKTIRPGIGEEVLIPAKAVHTVENIGSGRNTWYYGYKKY